MMMEQDSFMARRLGQLMVERVVEPHREIALSVMTDMQERLPADVRDCIGESHIAFGAACAYEAYQKLAEHNAMFELQWQATMRGVAKWRDANPGKDLVMPDHADFVVWLLDQVAPPNHPRARHGD